MPLKSEGLSSNRTKRGIETSRVRPGRHGSVSVSHSQLLPVLGSDLLIPIAQPAAKQQSGGILFCRMKGAEGRGHRTPDGFVVLQGSTAVLQERQSAKKWPYVIALRKKLIADGTLV